MTVVDPIADMITRIKNAIMANKREIDMPFSKIKLAIANVLKKEGYINNYKQLYISDNKYSILQISLRYTNKLSAIENIKRISKLSCRIYVTHDKIPQIMNGLGICILSTNQGVISDRLARSKQTGGEVLLAVW